jgi:CheY-like chemotaxis protein
VESTLGAGARFTVLLPATGQAVPAPAETVRTARQGRGRIVFVDDEADILALASQALSPLGYDIRTYERGMNALDAVRQAPDEVDLVITDQSMPGMAGTALALSLRDLRPTLPIIISSGFSQSIPPELLQSLEPVLLLPKPYSMGELAESIRRALGEGKGGGNGPESLGGG